MTVSDIVNGALTELGVLSPGETPSSDDTALGLLKLNRLISSWMAEKLAVFGVTVQTVAATGSETYTFTGTNRPVALLAVGVVSSAGIASAPKLVEADAYNAIPDKSRTGTIVDAAYYDGAYPTSTLYLTPKPSGGSIKAHGIAPVTAYAALGDTVVLPPGYERALIFGLALDMAPAFGRQVDATLAGLAQTAKFAVAGVSSDILNGAPAAKAAMQVAIQSAKGGGQ